jgi:hypothetical protein
MPCGRCLNCRNGAPSLCLGHDPHDAPRRIVARYCECGEPLYGKRRWCAECREKRLRIQKRDHMRKSRQGVEQNR